MISCVTLLNCHRLYLFSIIYPVLDTILSAFTCLIYVSNSESSGFADLLCSGFESVIYKESETSHVFLKSGFRMSLVFKAECSYENYILASSWLLGLV